jgi:hypothetical protein
MRRAILMVCCVAVSAPGYAREKIGVFPQSHELYERVKESFLLLDTLQFNDGFNDRLASVYYYFDPTADSLYSCTGEGDSGLCSGPEMRKHFVWSKHERAYARQNDLVPIDRHYSLDYWVDGATPFIQHSAYVYYSGRDKVVKCRRIKTSYNFLGIRDGKPIEFQSDKKDEYTEKCEQLYPRPVLTASKWRR